MADGNALYYGDNLDVLRQHIATESVDLIYLDPPFNSNRSYNVLFKSQKGAEAQAQIEAFDDTWHWSQQTEKQYLALIGGGAPARVADAIEAMRHLVGTNDVLAYLVMMTARLVELHRVLKPTGSLYLHCDPVASHYLKVILDAVFGPQNFRSEITWQRTNAHNDAKRWSPVADVIFYYGKTGDVTWNPVFAAHNDDYVTKKYRYADADGRRYMLDNMRSPQPRPNLTYDWKGFKPHPNGWAYSRETMERLDAEGKIWYPDSTDKKPRLKRYLDETRGTPLSNVWTDIRPINSQAAERLGYPTQKPVALLERIVKASSNEGDVVLDPFCGCGTALDAAQKLGRRWIGIDVTYLAIDLIRKRLDHTYKPDLVYDVHGIPRDFEGAKIMFEADPFNFERWAVSMLNAQPNEKQVGDRGIDGVMRFFAEDNHIGRALISVKGGKQINPAMVRDLVGTVQRERAELGVLILLTKPTRGMIEEADKSGSYERHGHSYPKIQIVNVADLLANRRPRLPEAILPYVQAKAAPRDQVAFEFD